MPRSPLLTVPQAACQGGLAGAEGEEEVPASLESILQQGRPDDIPSISFLQPSLLAPEAGKPRSVENSEVLAVEELQEKREVPRGLVILQNEASSVHGSPRQSRAAISPWIARLALGLPLALLLACCLPGTVVKTGSNP